MSRDFWNEERIEALRAGWAEGKSASQISATIDGSTRDMCIGKARRLGLEARPSPIKRDMPWP